MHSISLVTEQDCGDRVGGVSSRPSAVTLHAHSTRAVSDGNAMIFSPRVSGVSCSSTVDRPLVTWALAPAPDGAFPHPHGAGCPRSASGGRAPPGVVMRTPGWWPTQADSCATPASPPRPDSASATRWPTTIWPITGGRDATWGRLRAAHASSLAGLGRVPEPSKRSLQPVQRGDCAPIGAHADVTRSRGPPRSGPPRRAGAAQDSGSASMAATNGPRSRRRRTAARPTAL